MNNKQKYYLLKNTNYELSGLKYVCKIEIFIKLEFLIAVIIELLYLFIKNVMVVFNISSILVLVHA